MKKHKVPIFRVLKQQDLKSGGEFSQNAQVVGDDCQVAEGLQIR